MIADYKGDPIEPDRAAWAVDQSKLFVKKMCATFMPELDDKVNQSQNTNTLN
jgi:hypothetical protein